MITPEEQQILNELPKVEVIVGDLSNIDIKEGVKVTLKQIKSGFISIFEKNKFDKYSVQSWIHPSNAEAISKLQQVIQALKDKAKTNVNDDKIFLKKPAPNEYEILSSLYCIQASNDRQPLIFDQNANEVVTNNKLFIPGSILCVSGTVWFQNNEWGRRINFSLEGVQYVKPGPTLVMGKAIDKADVASRFEPVESEVKDMPQTPTPEV